MSELTIISALVIGLSLGVLGSGGAILTLPVLVYLMQYSEKVAVIGSLYIVGAIALFTAVPHILHRRVSVKHLIYFASPGLIGSYFGAMAGTFVEAWLQLSLFLILMLLAAIKMLSSNSDMANEEGPVNRVNLALAGTSVGFATGFVGVGGGFLIVPALVFLGSLPIKRAMATSIVIIFMQSSIGLISYYQHGAALFNQVNWQDVTIIAVIGVLGAYLGLKISKHINQQKLSRGFGYFLIVMALFILTQKII